ncbi:ER membrane protein complex subunit 8 [Balamuthia mandrillaris]
MPRYSIRPLAYSKLLLHSAKYPHQAVNGVLVGTTESTKGDNAVIEDYIPLFHGHTLAPLLEVAMHLIEEYCAKQGQEILGYFHANELAADTEFGALAQKIADRLCLWNPKSIALLLEEPKKQATNEAEENTTALPLRAFIKDSNKWQEKKGLVAPHPDEELDRKQLRRLLSDPSRCLLLLNDFDNHLDDVHLAWLTQNPLLLL